MYPFRLLRRLPFNPKSAIRNPKLLIVLLSVFPLLLCNSSIVLAQWEPDVRLTYNDSASSTSLNNARCIVAVPGGNVHVVWFDRRDGNYEIYYKRSSDAGVTWSQDLRLTYSPLDSWEPSVAASGTAVHVAWRDSRDGNYEIYYIHSTDGGVSWSSEVRLTNNPALSQQPCIAASDSNVHLIWSDERSYSIYYKRSTNGGSTWSQDTCLPGSSVRSQYPTLALSYPWVHAAWHDSRDGGRTFAIYYLRSTDNGASWSPETTLVGAGATSWSPSLAVSGENVYGVWRDDREGSEKIFFKRSTDRGRSWSPDTRLTTDSSGAWSPCVSASGSNVHVVWRDSRDGNYEIYYKRSTDEGLTWSQDTRLTSDPAWSYRPSLDIADQMVHVVWMDQRDHSLYEVYYKRNPTGNVGVEDGVPLRLTSYASRLTAFPNPFTSFTTLPGHEAERFSVYDISGRLVGTYKGGQVGVGLSPGVFFLCPSGQNSKPLRIVKIR